MKAFSDVELLEQAIAHTKLMDEKYIDEIIRSCDGTNEYDEDTDFRSLMRNKKRSKTKPEFILENMDSVRAAFKYSAEGDICVHNYASYTNPGGGFIRGANAQEEQLCHESFLYNVLARFPEYYTRNRANVNSYMYENRALYSRGVLLMKKNNPHRTISADILTCAAPNYAAGKRMISKEVNRNAMDQRVDFISRIIEVERPDIFITGAFGCGVFGQNPSEVCCMMIDRFRYSSVKKVVFAIPGGPNFDAFKKILS